jgi:hypothetical protein
MTSSIGRNNIIVTQTHRHIIKSKEKAKGNIILKCFIMYIALRQNPPIFLYDHS